FVRRVGRLSDSRGPCAPPERPHQGTVLPTTSYNALPVSSLANRIFWHPTCLTFRRCALCAAIHSFAGGHMLHRILWAGALASLAVSTPLAAQQRSVGPSFGITPYAGYMKFGN